VSRTVRAFALAITLALVAAAAGPIEVGAALPLGATATSDADPSRSPALPLPGAEDVAAAFAAAGVDVTPIDGPVASGEGVTLTDWQVGNLARQASAGAGLSGRQLREAFPVADDGVPVDAIVAAWLVTGESASATAARTIMAIDVTTIRNPATVIYPWAVLVLFVHDLSSSLGEAPAGLRDGPSPAEAALPESGSGVCGALSDFYAAMTSAIVAALEQVPVIGTLAELAVQLFEEVLGTAVKPVQAAIGVAITALGIAAVVAHIIDPWVFFIDKEPLLVIDYGIAPNPGNPGSFTARIEGGAILEWPAAVQACAALAGVQLPDLHPNGATVSWTVAFGPHATVTSQQGTISEVNGAFVARLDYVTAIEPAEAAAGEPVSAPINVSVKVVRPADQQLDAIVEQIVGDALSGLPQPIADLLASLAGTAIGSIAQFNDPTGNESITVRFHAPPPPTTTVPSTSPPTTPAQSCIGRVLHGQAGVFVGTTLLIRPDGTWALDFAGFPPQEYQGVTVTFAGQWIGTWTPTDDGTGFVIVPDLNSPFTATGTYQGVTLELTMEQLIGLLGDLIGAPVNNTPGIATCTNGNITTPTGEIMYS
jgi:hypothetical protein